MRVDVEVGEVFGHIAADFALFLFFLFFQLLLVEVANDHDVGWLNLIGIRLTEVGEKLFTLRNLVTSQHPDADEFEEHTSGSLNVGGGVVCRVEPCAEEDLVNLVQLGQFEASALAAREFAVFGGFLGAGIHPRPGQQRVLVTVAEELTPHDAEVEVDVMAHEILGFLGRLQELVEHLMQRQSVF